MARMIEIGDEEEPLYVNPTMVESVSAYDAASDGHGAVVVMMSGDRHVTRRDLADVVRAMERAT